ncbi:MAG: plasmid recombination protein, partial [bacterium]
MNYAILRTQKLKTFANVKGCSDHHSRNRKTENANPDIKNELIIGSGDPYSDVRKRIDESGAHYRSNSNKAIEVLLTASPEYFRPSAPEKAGRYEKQPTNAFKQRATKWLQEYFGEDNV